MEIDMEDESGSVYGDYEACCFCGKNTYSNLENDPTANLLTIHQLSDGSNICAECTGEQNEKQ